MSVTKIQPVKIKTALCCPKCGEDLTRISKTPALKILALALPVGRYKCYRCLREYTRFL
ncbi:MAG: hypothetical protein JSS76_16930 [Bacteroidetes bacterium]|nr:hypothetical protein [Bacteroidota bacterium]MBS1686425.1 hypothetical protein [Bacteroidota bacterium]